MRKSDFSSLRRAGIRTKGLTASIAGSMMLLAASSALALPQPDPPCSKSSGVTCSHNALFYIDQNLVIDPWLKITLSQNADGSGETVDDFAYWNTVTGTWSLADAFSQVSYAYTDGYDEFGEPIVMWQTAYAPESVPLADGRVLDLSIMNTGQGGRISNLADGQSPMDAVNKRQLDAAISSVSVGGADPLAVKYTDNSKTAVSVGGQVKNVANGTASTDAVNVSQLNDVRTVATNAASRAEVGVTNAASAQATANTAQAGVDSLNSVAVKYTDANKTAVSVGGQVKNVANGTASTDAVNVSQLDGVRTVATNAASRAEVGVTNAATAQAGVDLLNQNALLFSGSTYTALREGQATRISGVADGVDASDAVNVSQLEKVVGDVSALGDDALLFDGLVYNAQRGGQATRISGVADGVDASDAVNVGQLEKVAGDVSALTDDALLFDGQTYNAQRGGQATRISGVADGVDATDAVNVGQLDDVRTVADTAASRAEIGILKADNAQLGVDLLNQNALLFSGSTYSALRGGQATRISGVADGLDATDAVNVAQLEKVVGDVSALTDDALLFDGQTYNAQRGGQATRISGVADGVDATDAVNVSQLEKVAGDLAGISQDALLFDGQVYSAWRNGQATRISGVAAGLLETDAASFGQLDAVTAIFGAGAQWNSGVFTAPSYTIAGNTYGNVGDAFAAVDTRITDLEGRIFGVEQSPGGTQSVIYDTPNRDAVTLEGQGGTRISNVADGVDASDAATVGQLSAVASESREYTDQVAQTTLSDSKQYTDTRFNDMWNAVDDLTARFDQRFKNIDRRIDRQSAMNAAMTSMAMNAAGSRSENGRIGAGIGFSSGQRALAVGYSRAIGKASFSFGGSISGGESSAGIGFGFDL